MTVEVDDEGLRFFNALECRTRRKMHGLLLHAGSRLAKCFMLDG